MYRDKSTVNVGSRVASQVLEGEDQMAIRAKKKKAGPAQNKKRGKKGKKRVAGNSKGPGRRRRSLLRKARSRSFSSTDVGVMGRRLFFQQRDGGEEKIEPELMEAKPRRKSRGMKRPAAPTVATLPQGGGGDSEAAWPPQGQSKVEAS